MAQRLIDANDLQNKMCDACDGCPPDGDKPCRFIKLILNAPTVSPKRPTGQLIKTVADLVCSKCGTVHRGTEFLIESEDYLV